MTGNALNDLLGRANPALDIAQLLATVAMSRGEKMRAVVGYRVIRGGEMWPVTDRQFRGEYGRPFVPVPPASGTNIRCLRSEG